MAQKILVASGKGGVGKTTICTQVGAALARRGLRVLTAELDAGFRSMDLLLELESGVVFDLADVLEGRCAPDAAVQTHAADADVALVHFFQIVPPLRQKPGHNQIRRQLPGQGAVHHAADEVFAVFPAQGADDLDAA